MMGFASGLENEIAIQRDCVDHRHLHSPNTPLDDNQKGCRRARFQQGLQEAGRREKACLESAVSKSLQNVSAFSSLYEG